MAPKRYFRNTHHAQRSANTTQPFFQPTASEAEHAGGQNSFFTPAPVTVQAQLTVGQPGDRYEQEADAMADRVVNASPGNTPVASAADGNVQRATQPKEEEKVQRAEKPEEEEKVQRAVKPEKEEKVQRAAKLEEEEKVQRTAKPEEEEKVQRAAKPEEEEKVQRAAKVEEEKNKPMLQAFAPGSGGTTVGPSTAARLISRKGGGSPLPATVHQDFSGAFGHDFSRVRIHTDSEAESLSDGLGAQAFTLGQDVYFNKGKFNPDSQDGKRLLAHELTHVVQQEGKVNTPEVQRDAGVTLAVVGLIFSVGTWAAGQGGDTARIDPLLNRIAEMSAERERYRTANPFRLQNWEFFNKVVSGPIFDSRWTVDLRWQFNGAEITDVHLVTGYEDAAPGDEMHAKLIMIDNQASNKKIGFRCEFHWNPISFGNYLYQCDGWISADGSGNWTSPWRIQNV